MENDIFDLEAIIKHLSGNFSSIEDVYLFGSRRYDTGSPRSDIDILITFTEFIKPALLREYTLENCIALDIFCLENGKATSVANESHISAKDNNELIGKLNAVLLYSKTSGVSSALSKWKKIELDKRVNPVPTALPNTSIQSLETNALLKYLNATKSNNLPTKPYLGVTIEEVCNFIVDIIRRMIPVSKSVAPRGQAKDGWTNNIKDEYDFQNLFWIITKSWLPELSRETVTINYDGQNKKCDFSLFNNQLFIEFKHVKDNNTKSIIIKTLSGLQDFYSQHPNAKCLIFAVLVDEEVSLDDLKWESDYSDMNNEQLVQTVVIRNPSRNES